MEGRQGLRVILPVDRTRLRHEVHSHQDLVRRPANLAAQALWEEARRIQAQQGEGLEGRMVLPPCIGGASPGGVPTIPLEVQMDM